MSDSSTRATFDHLPTLSTRPDYAPDYTGKRRGTMTAIAWYRPSRSGKGALWLCRCNCGLYEYRRPGTWESRPHPDDTCDICLRAKGPNARQTAPERLRQWMDGLRGLGLTDTEVAWLRDSGSGVDTRGKTAAEIREQIVKCVSDSIRP